MVLIKLDILVLAAHPDDAELSCGGILLNEKKNGNKTGIIDLTRGELGTRGTAETRKLEAAKAAEILQLDVRDNLGLADGFFQNDEAHQRAVIRAIRTYQPEIILTNAPEDRHPDHGRAAQLVESSSFLSGLRRIETLDDSGQPQEPWRPRYVFNFIQDRYLDPDVIVDISDVFEQKMEAIKAYGTQFFNPALNEPTTYISTPGFYDSIIERAKMLGRMIGVPYGEGFMSKKKIGLRNLDCLVVEPT